MLKKKKKKNHYSNFGQPTSLYTFFVLFKNSQSLWIMKDQTYPRDRPTLAPALTAPPHPHALPLL